jgi:transcriptional regulator with XRE-family HTH domain
MTYPNPLPDLPDLSILKRAGIGQNEFAELLGVSTTAISHWANGNRRPIPLLRRALESMLDKIGEAVEDGRLPLAAPPTGTRDWRKQRQALLADILT